MDDHWTDEYDQAWERCARRAWIGAKLTPMRGAIMLSFGHVQVWEFVPRNDHDAKRTLRRLRYRLSMDYADAIIGTRPAHLRPQIPD